MTAPEIPLFKVFLPPREALAGPLLDTLYSGRITEGPKVVEFERRFGEMIGNPNLLTCYSGTAALHLALMLAGVGPGDEVVSTAMTAEPTNMAILEAGARVAWADVDPANGNVTGASVAAAITPRTKAIMVVHYGGIPAPLADIHAVAERHGVPVIEDAAHALGARYGGRSLGSHSPFVMFSFQAIKHMTTVDGGALAVADPGLLPKGRRLRWFGIDRALPRLDVSVEEVGWKYHMNDVTAQIGLVQLDHIGPVLARHIDNGRWFDAALAGVPGLTVARWDAAAEPSYWFYTVLAENRDGLARKLSEAGIANSLIHRRNDEHPVFGPRVPLPGLDDFCARVLHFPCGWWVADEDRERIAQTIRSGW
ncbi:MAG: DegT/DnrJ/EryC1/StrS family aminotransferase [Actinomycetota bacterium]